MPRTFDTDEEGIITLTIKIPLSEGFLTDVEASLAEQVVGEQAQRIARQAVRDFRKEQDG